MNCSAAWAATTQVAKVAADMTHAWIKLQVFILTPPV
jgi:hypothetical protein